MITDLNQYLIGLVIGIRFRANFSIEDKLGQIVDNILYTNNSFFNSKLFPKVYNNVNEKILINETTGDLLKIDNSNLILEVNFSGDNCLFKRKNINKIYSNFNEQIINGIMKRYKIKEINRIGVVNRYIFDIKELADIFIDKTIGETLGGVNDINLRFSRKFPASEAMVKKDVFDYHNAIFNIIKKSDLNEIFMSIDYQKYFDPFMPSVTTLKFLEFVKNVDHFNNEKYLSWLNSNYGKLL